MEEINQNFPDPKKLRMERAVRRKNLKKLWWFLAVLAVAAILVIAGVKFLRKKEAELPGVFVADQGREHIPLGRDHPSYNSNPPTSGWHHPNPAAWGVYSEQLPDEVLIHNLEHGGIWISYKPEIFGEIREKLESFYKKWGSKIIVEPRAQNDSDIALAAWNRLDKFSAAEYSDERVERFIRAFRNKGPEFVP